MARNDPNYNLAGIYAFLGNKDLAYQHLKEYCFSSGLEYYISHDPLFKSLWSEPKFQQLIEDAKREKLSVRAKLDQMGIKGKF